MLLNFSRSLMFFLLFVIPKDLISIIQALKEAGALIGILKVI